MNADLLKSIMVLHHDTNRTLAEYLGISEQTMCSKMKESGSEFKQGEIAKIKVRYSLDNNQIDSIFFAGLVSNLDTGSAT